MSDPKRPKGRVGMTTRKGFAIPHGAMGVPDDERTVVDPAAQHDGREEGDGTDGGGERTGGHVVRRRARTPAVEIDLVHERGAASLIDGPWRALEIWTRHRVYALDSSLTCIDVVDQASRQSDPSHPLIGARLVGGQQRDGEVIELSHPFPRPGSEAVFEQSSGKRVRFSQTSPVTRVVLRLRVLTVAPDYLVPAWEDISGSLRIGDLPPAPKKR
ncbi:MAG: hypothetical protein IT379_31985 [Deltaproteobacteria bacterium]|nr:hypothetical protein [Deltaproteobacteria bacterium]